jgi:hypothetical protein
MDKYKILSTLKTYVESKSMVFIAGDDFHKNWEVTKQNILNNKLIFGCDPFIITPKIKNGVTQVLEYSSSIMLGLKFDALVIDRPADPDAIPPTAATYLPETFVNLDETFIQKIPRLEYLIISLASIIGTFACDNELEINSFSVKTDIDRFDECVDFVVAYVSFTQY